MQASKSKAEAVELVAAALGIDLKATVEKNVEVKREGKVIRIPEGMTNREAITWLERKDQEEEKKVALHHQIPCSPLDGLVALHRALADIYGWTDLVPTPGFWGSDPPVMIGVPVGPGKTVQVPYGRVTIPKVYGYLETSFDWGKNPGFLLTGETKQKYLPDIQTIRERLEYHLKHNSIYRGQAVKVSFEWQRKKEKFELLHHAPQFMDVSGIKENDLILAKAVQRDLDIGLFLPIKESKIMRKCQVPLKRGCLMHGKYGVGKSLTAAVTAKVATGHGWTFLYLSSTEDLEMGLKFAKQYSPCVVFCEDVDKCLEGSRNVDMDQLLNLLDGIDTKTQECFVVFTTNHVEKINRAALRMGRLDTVVEIKEPDAEAAIRLVELYGRGLLEPDQDLAEAGEALQGRIPAFIRETVERAKIAAIGRLRENGELNEDSTIVGQVRLQDILDASHAMRAHADMLSETPAPNRKHAQVLVSMPADADFVDDVLESVGAMSNGQK